MHLFLVLGADLAQAVGRDFIEQPVGLAILDGGHRGLLAQAEVILHLVGIAVGLRLFAPHLEMGIADHDQGFVRVIGFEHIGAGAGNGHRARILGRCIGWEDHRMREAQLVEELGIRLGEIDSYGSSCLVTHDAALERAFRRFCQAFVGADDDGIEGARGRAGDLEDALQRGDDVLDAQFPAVGELDPLAQLEGVALAVVGWRRDRFREIGNDGEAIAAGRMFEADQAVIDRLIELPVLQSVIDMGIKRPAGGAGEKTHRTTAMLGLVFGIGCAAERRQKQGRGACQQPFFHITSP